MISRLLGPGARIVDGSRRALVALLASVPIALGATQCTPPNDWCSSIVVRPDQRFVDPAHCTPEWTDAAIANLADVVLLGDFNDVAQPVIPAPPRTCAPRPSHAENAAYVSRLRAARAATGRAPLEIVHLSRFELVPATLAAIPGFRSHYLLRTRTAWSSVLNFFSQDHTSACLPKSCRWSDSWGGHEGKDLGNRLRDQIDAEGGSGTYQSVVQYMARPDATGVYWSTAGIADLRSPFYRAWRVNEARRALSVGGYDMVDLNQKLHQLLGGQHWIRGAWVPNVAVLNQSADTYWTAAPESYTYTDYVTGWHALALDLRNAGIPFSVTLPEYLWSSNAYDELWTTAVDEAALIRDVASWATLVLVDRPRDFSATAWAKTEKKITASGARVVPFDQTCPLAGD